MANKKQQVDPITKGLKPKEISIEEIRGTVILKMLNWARHNQDSGAGLRAQDSAKVPIDIDGDDVNKMAQLETYWPAFPENYGVYIADGATTKIPVGVDKDRVVRLIDFETIEDEVLNYYMSQVRLTFNKAKLRSMTSAIAREITKQWRSRWSQNSRMFKPLSEIRPVCFKSDPCFTWRRLPFDLADGRNMPTPTYDEWLSRFSSNQDAFMACIGKIFIPGSYRTQCPWIKGQGRDTKSSVVSALKWALGDACVLNAQIPEKNGEKRFWSLSHILGKRLVIFPDFDNYKWIKSGEFRALTGDDYCQAEVKGRGSAFQIKNDAFFLFMSNEFPAVLNMTAIRRRMIMIEVDSYNGPMLQPAQVSKLLIEELPGFLFKCVELAKKYPGEIPVDESVLDDLIQSSESGFEETYHTYFTPTNDGTESRLPARDLQFIARRQHPKAYYRFEEFFSRKHPKKRARIKDPETGKEKTLVSYLGVRLNDLAVNQQNYDRELRSF